MHVVFTAMDSETNRRPKRGQSAKLDPKKNQSLQEAVIRDWNHYRETSDTIVDRYFRGMEVVRTLCKCGMAQVTVNPFLFLSLAITESTRTLNDLLQLNYRSEILDSYKCDGCSATGTSTRTTWIGRLPEVIIIQLLRFRVEDKVTKKMTQRIEFAIEELDFEPFYIPTNERSFGTESPEDSAWGQRFKYRIYGIVVHMGNTADSGHYWSFVRRADPEKGTPVWYEFNDARVRRLGTDSEFTKRYLRDVWKNGDRVPYVLFLQRVKEQSK